RRAGSSPPTAPSGRAQASPAPDRFTFGSQRLTIGRERGAVATRVSLALVALAVSSGVVVAAGFAGPAQKKGGTLRIARPRDIDSVDPAIADVYDSFGMIEFATCAK